MAAFIPPYEWFRRRGNIWADERLAASEDGMPFEQKFYNRLPLPNPGAISRRPNQQTYLRLGHEKWRCDPAREPRSRPPCTWWIIEQWARLNRGAVISDGSKAYRIGYSVGNKWL